MIGGRRGAREGREWVSMCSDVACHTAAGGPRQTGRSPLSGGGGGRREAARVAMSSASVLSLVTRFGGL